ncbi:LysR family transcriptional regulator [Sphingomonas sp. CGMCC 1.13654]|uniref:LysR family transcriptional regulator n=1 Tax=Sphingomonas chungangi TaxID=2683589 RepID=A0A838L9S5_9SPHN|nr:LysR family transcriptional regulator [Sphingomonas chungangi]MBA2934866.1 LysR family transcriptional regulator [Sphingomonas chungangi]MVW58177.1 LysR family transcriptional regulator [Sphingomonas chungangi]
MTELGDLDAFVAVAEARSFRGAGKLRGVPASSLSDAVRRLEERLGVRLLNRTTRSVTATEAGGRLLERLVPALGEVGAALDMVNDYRDSPTGTLRLNAPIGVTRLILPRIVPAFLAAHPGITLELSSEDRFIDVLAAGFDAGIRYEERLEQDMIAVPIGPRIERFACGAAPAYLDARGRPEHPRDILHHACIRHRFASGVTINTWEFECDGEIVRVTPDGPFIGTDAAIELDVAIAGIGLIFAFEGLLAPSFAEGSLEPVLPDWWQRFSGPFLYYPSRRLMPAPLRAFVDFIKRA